MFSLNKIVVALTNPIVMVLALLLVVMVLGVLGRKKLALTLTGITAIMLWLCSTPMMYRCIGGGLEREWPIVLVESMPKADAIVLLGGGIGANTNVYPYAEMYQGADRVWHAARLWKAGKAPIVIVSGEGERDTSVPLLKDFGVDEAAIVVEDKARNTEENAKGVEAVLATKNIQEAKVLLVTSARHMRRSVYMFKKYATGLEIIPAATDYEALVKTGNGFTVGDLISSIDCFSANAYCLKEYIGYWGYKLLR